MEVTVSSGYITLYYDTASTSAPTVLNANTIIRFEPILGDTYSPDPAQSSNPFEAQPMQKADNWKVVVVMNDRQIDPIYLLRVTNQPSWTNDLSGAQQAVTDLIASLI